MTPITEPVPFTEAFAREDDAAVHSQAACLLLLGAQLESDPFAFEVQSAIEGVTGPTERLAPEDVEPLGVPSIRATGERWTRDGLLSGLAKDFALGAEELRERPLPLVELASQLKRNPEPRVAAELFEACLQHPIDLVRLAAAIASLRVSAEPARLLDLVITGTRSEDPLVRDLAAVALAQFAPEHPRLRELLTPTALEEEAGASDSLIVHGTFARGNSWWQPGGDFHTYLRDSVRPELYSDPDRYDWTGGYSDHARSVAAGELFRWVEDRDLGGLDLFTHSHGGSVAMLATHLGLQVGELVLLSCPAHPGKYLPQFDRVGKVVSIRVRLDLVILVDGGGQRFRHPLIEENVLPIWFNHSATHDPEVWVEHNVPGEL